MNKLGMTTKQIASLPITDFRHVEKEILSMRMVHESIERTKLRRKLQAISRGSSSR